MSFRFDFLLIKAIPTLFWSSPKTFTIRPPMISLIFLIFGLILFGLGEAILIAAGMGVSPWTVFAQGVTNFTGWGIGFATFITSAVVLLIWIPLKQIPGIGTILNTVIIALILDLALPYIPRPEDYFSGILLSVVGVLVTGFGGGIYLIANLGPGPRDGLMTGLQKATNLPIAWIRSVIELSVVVIGWFLGGIVGFGTLLFAFGIGPSVAIYLYGFQKVFGEITVKNKKIS